MKASLLFVAGLAIAISSIAPANAAPANPRPLPPGGSDAPGLLAGVFRQRAET